jgi:hypothetical protein
MDCSYANPALRGSRFSVCKIATIMKLQQYGIAPPGGRARIETLLITPIFRHNLRIARLGGWAWIATDSWQPFPTRLVGIACPADRVNTCASSVDNSADGVEPTEVLTYQYVASRMLEALSFRFAA